MIKSTNPPPTRRSVSKIKNRTIFTGDNLHIMRGMESESIDLIYLDPPFNSKHDYAAPIGSKAAGAEFKDTWTLSDIDDAWVGQIEETNKKLFQILMASETIGNKSIKSYLVYMTIRILEMYRILKSTGSLYLHCDPTMSHYVKIILDAMFGVKNFRNEIVWKRVTSGQKGSQHKTKKFGNNHDNILVYCKNVKLVKFIPPKRQLTEQELNEKFKNIDDDGRRWKDDSAHIWSTPGMGARPNLCYEWNGFKNRHPSGWRLSKERLIEEWEKGNFEIRIKKDGTRRLIRKVYSEDYTGENMGDVWTDIPNITSGKEKMGYPTQKPIALLERIIRASSDEDNLVLDPFCGCATACLASERLDRRWIGIDISKKAHELIKQRLQEDAGLDKFTKGAGEVIHRTDIPKRKGQRSSGIKHTLYGKQGGRCNGCRHCFDIRNFEVDHIVPIANGGLDDDSNLQLLCGNCNRIKGKKPMEYLISRRKELGLN